MRYPLTLIRSLAILIAVSMAPPARAADAIPAEQSKCEIDPVRYGTMTVVDKKGKIVDRVPPYTRENPPPTFIAPHHDQKSNITFTVENDGRHVKAMDGSGKLLWRRNPFVDNDMCPYRSAHPYIASISPSLFGPKYTEADHVRWLKQRIVEFPASAPPGAHVRTGDHFVELRFNSSQFGDLNTRTGDFYPMGQN